MIKLIAIDLDGTLLTDAKTISERNKTVLQQAKAAGVKIVICTGRPLKAIEAFLVELDLLHPGDYSITFNGGLVQKNDTGEIMEKAAMAVADIQSLYDLGKELQLPIDVVSGEKVFRLPSTKAHPSIYQELNPAMTYFDVELTDITDQYLYNKAVVANEAGYLDQQIQLIPQDYRDRFEIIKSRSNLLEFMPKGVTKAYGISLLAKDLGITQAEVMALGDEENDLPMIAYAGIGVAMANAVPVVKAAANVVTSSNEADGVAEAVEKYVLRPLKK